MIILGCVTSYAFYNVCFSRLLVFGINLQVLRHYNTANLCVFILTLEFIRRFNNINSNVAFCAEIHVLVLLYSCTDIVYYVKE